MDSPQLLRGFVQCGARMDGGTGLNTLRVMRRSEPSWSDPFRGPQQSALSRTAQRHEACGRSAVGGHWRQMHHSGNTDTQHTVNLRHIGARERRTALAARTWGGPPAHSVASVARRRTSVLLMVSLLAAHQAIGPPAVLRSLLVGWALPLGMGCHSVRRVMLTVRYMRSVRSSR